MSKTKKIIVLFVVLLTVGAAGNIYLSMFLHLTLKHKFTSASQLNMADCLASLMNDKTHQLLYLTILLLIGTICCAVFFMERGKENYASDLDRITESISTPVSIGQGQHGTAKWLKPGVYAKVFFTVEIDPAKELIADLLAHGYDDLPDELKGGKCDVQKKKTLIQSAG